MLSDLYAHFNTTPLNCMHLKNVLKFYLHSDTNQFLYVTGKCHLTDNWYPAEVIAINNPETYINTKFWKFSDDLHSPVDMHITLCSSPITATLNPRQYGLNNQFT